MDKKISVETSIGNIIVYDSGYGEEYPGFYIDFVPIGRKETEAVGIALVEVDEHGGDDGGARLHLRSWVRNNDFGPDEDGYYVEGKVGFEAAFSDVSLSIEDLLRERE